jgi:uncharacterized membrane-anchored protein
VLNKVSEITLVFWTIKILSTTVGETGADYLAMHVGLGGAREAATLRRRIVRQATFSCVLRC